MLSPCWSSARPALSSVSVASFSTGWADVAFLAGAARRSLERPYYIKIGAFGPGLRRRDRTSILLLPSSAERSLRGDSRSLPGRWGVCPLDQTQPQPDTPAPHLLRASPFLSSRFGLRFPGSAVRPPRLSGPGSRRLTNYSADLLTILARCSHAHGHVQHHRC